jgi:hypothetical protein
VTENSPPGTRIDFGDQGGAIQVLRVFHQNSGESLRLAFACHEGAMELCTAFQILPGQGMGNFSFEVRVGDASLLDHEARKEIKFMVC